MHNSSTGGETNISNLLHGLAESINKKGLIILISDLLDDEDKVMESLRHFRYKGHEIIVFHIVDPKEKDLNYKINGDCHQPEIILDMLVVLEAEE